MRFTARCLALFALVVSAGCEEEKLTCSEGLAEVHTLLDERWEDPNECAAHCECISPLIDVECPGGPQLYNCGFAIHRDSMDEFEPVMASVREDICDRVDPACSGGGGCSGVAACIDGRCIWTTDPSFASSPTDAGAVDACAPSP